MSMPRGESLTIVVQAEIAPTSVSVSIYEEGKEFPPSSQSAAVQRDLQIGSDRKARLPIDLAPGTYYMSVHGYWRPTGDLGHQFKILVGPPSP